MRVAGAVEWKFRVGTTVPTLFDLVAKAGTEYINRPFFWEKVCKAIVPVLLGAKEEFAVEVFSAVCIWANFALRGAEVEPLIECFYGALSELGELLIHCASPGEVLHRARKTAYAPFKVQCAVWVIVERVQMNVVQVDEFKFILE